MKTGVVAYGANELLRAGAADGPALTPWLSHIHQRTATDMRRIYRLLAEWVSLLADSTRYSLTTPSIPQERLPT
jgi:hypothetical protein